MSNEILQEKDEKILRTNCHLCHGGCILLAHVKDGKLVKTEGDPNGPYNRGSICPKGAAAPQVVHSPYRIKYPMKRVGKRGEGKWQRISWDEALDIVAEKLKYYKDTYGGECITYSTGTGRVKDTIPFKEFFSGVIGTPNMIGIGHLCITKTRCPTVTITAGFIPGLANLACLRDFDEAKCIVLWGTTAFDSNEDRISLAGRRITDSLKRGTKLIVIDPVYTRAAQKAHMWLPIRPGTDMALAMAWQNIIIKEGLYDKEFVEKWTNAPFLWRSDTRKLLRPSDVVKGGSPTDFMVWDKKSKSVQIWNSKTVSYEKPKIEAALTGTYKVTLANGKSVNCKPVWQLIIDNTSEWTPEKTSKVTWLPADKIVESARMYATNLPASIEWGVSMSQCTRSTATNQSIMQLKAIIGMLDVRGGQPFWWVPGFRSAGLGARLGDDAVKMTKEQELKRISGGYPFSSESELTLAPSAHQPDVWRAIHTGKPYPVRVLFGVDSNPLVGHENPEAYILEALKKLEFIVWLDIVMTPSNEFADIILPVCTPLERNYVTDRQEYGLFAGQAVVEPQWESRSDFYIFRDLYKRFGREDLWPWKTEKDWCNYQMEQVGITFDQISKTAFYPAPETWRKYEKGLLRKDKKPGFPTPSGKVELYSSLLEKFGIEPLPIFKMPVQSYETTPAVAKEYPLILITGSRELNYPFFHSMHRHVPQLRELQRYPVLLINPKTAGKLGISDGDWAWIETKKGRVRQKAQVTERIHPNIVSAGHDFWYPELPAPLHGVLDSNINLLVDPSLGTDPATGTTELRGLLCKVYRADGPPPGVIDESFKKTKIKSTRKKT